MKMVIVRAGFNTINKTNKYQLGVLLNKTEQSGIEGYNVRLASGDERFYFSQQITPLATYKKRIHNMKLTLDILSQVGFKTNDSFEGLCYLEEELQC